MLASEDNFSSTAVLTMSRYLRISLPNAKSPPKNYDDDV